jgi:hypothetical protein
MRLSFTPYAGVRYMKHDLDVELSVTQPDPATASTFLLSGGAENDWTDVLFGASVGYVFSPRLTWNASADAGFGGSEGTYTFKTSLNWKAGKHLSLGPNFKYSAIEYENGEKGDSDWYRYDADEFGAGIGVTAHF